MVTDKDMAEINCFKSAMPQIQLQLCLFCLKRNFYRELSAAKHNITQEERQEYLQYVEELVQPRDEAHYQHLKTEFFT